MILVRKRGRGCTINRVSVVQNIEQVGKYSKFNERRGRGGSKLILSGRNISPMKENRKKKSGKVSQVICDLGYPFRSDLIFGINENLQRIRLSVETLRNFSVIPLVLIFVMRKETE